MVCLQSVESNSLVFEAQSSCSCLSLCMLLPLTSSSGCGLKLVEATPIDGSSIVTSKSLPCFSGPHNSPRSPLRSVVRTLELTSVFGLRRKRPDEGGELRSSSGVLLEGHRPQPSERRLLLQQVRLLDSKPRNQSCDKELQLPLSVEQMKDIYLFNRNEVKVNKWATLSISLLLPQDLGGWVMLVGKTHQHHLLALNKHFKC